MTYSDPFNPPSVDELHVYRAAIIRARSSGEKRIVYQANGVTREVEYRNDSELKAALISVDALIAKAEGRPALTVCNIRSAKGFA